jgi:hypothetical protein
LAINALAGSRGGIGGSSTRPAPNRREPPEPRRDVRPDVLVVRPLVTEPPLPEPRLDPEPDFAAVLALAPAVDWLGAFRPHSEQ